MKKIHCIQLLMALWLYPLFIYPQYPGDIIELNSTPAAGEIKACQSIILKPGFSFTASPGQSLTLKIDPNACAVNVYENISLSASQNYIIKVTPLDETDHVDISANKIEIVRDTRLLTSIQYFDGLGRPVQTVQRGFSPHQGKDLVTELKYDNFGREWKTYLPVPVSNNNGAFVLNVPTKVSTYTNDSKPYSETVYEQSPLNRIVKQFGPGEDWYNGNGHPVTMDYKTNSTTDDALKCLYFYVSGNNLEKNNYYAANQLYVTETKDEDSKVLYQFNDKLGRMVLTRQLLSTTSTAGSRVDTYYVYDDFGNLCIVLPPIAVDSLNGASWDESNTILKKYAYLYRYDERKRCTAKRVPGCDWQYMAYDRADRLIFSQDGEQRLKNKWMFYAYDVFDRLVISGLCNNTQTVIDNHKPLITSAEFKFELSNPSNAYFAGTGYQLNNLTVNNPEIHTVNYYDNYKFLDLPVVSSHKSSLNYSSKSGYGVQYANSTCSVCSTKGLLTGNRVRILNNVTGETIHAMYYDERNRLIQNKSTTHDGGFMNDYCAYTFTGQTLKRMNEYVLPAGKTFMFMSGPSGSLSELYEYEYDHAGRLKKTSFNGTVIEGNTYNELGQLQNKQQGLSVNNSGSALNTSYTYNIRGWLKTLSESVTGFQQTLYYQDFSPKYYNGNIAVMTYKYANAPTTAQRTCQYYYDRLNRMTGSYFISPLYDLDGEFAGYDKHGNPKSISRIINHYEHDGWSISYNGNQKTSVEGYTGELGPVSNVTGAFTYNKNGAQTSDTSRDIVTIRYNALNLPDTVQFKYGNAIYYTYDASGMKLQTKHITVKPNLANPITLAVGQVRPLTQLETLSELTTDYIGNHILEDGGLKMTLFPGGYSRYEMVSVEGVLLGLNHYYNKDYLGNNRDVIWDGTVVQRTEYTPFGVSFPQTVGDAAAQHYKFGGKELDRMHGLDYYDFLARMYDPLLGSFMTPDPLAEKYYNISPYAYCKNNPLIYTDPSGLWPTPIHNTMITKTFSGLVSLGLLNDNDIGFLMEGSKIADSGVYQTTPYNHQHGMRQKGESVKQAEAKYNKFIDKQFNLYLNAENDKDAFIALGMALHAIMDSSSPTHHGFQVWKGFLMEKGFGLSHALGEQMKAYLDPANQAMINTSKEQMYSLMLKALAAKGEINLLPEVIVIGSKSKNSMQNSNKSFNERMQDMLWQSVSPNSFGNTGRYNQPGRSTDNLYSDEFLKWYYDK